MTLRLRSSLACDCRAPLEDSRKKVPTETPRVHLEPEEMQKHALGFVARLFLFPLSSAVLESELSDTTLTMTAVITLSFKIKMFRKSKIALHV
jgi:hypothetical protein